MKLIYSRPILRDLSKGSRMAFARQFRTLSQDEVAKQLGVSKMSHIDKLSLF